MHGSGATVDDLNTPPRFSFAFGETKGIVSVVMPTFRQERFVVEALESLDRQTYSHWELLVVEDGSDGGSQAIINEFARTHAAHRVEYARNERNCGPSHARNMAFSKSRGEFIALLDSDDKWFPDHLATAVPALASTDGHIAYSSVVMFEDTTDLLLGTWGPTARDLEEFPYSLFRRNFINPSATIFRRQVLADVGAWDVTLRCCEDLDFWLRCASAGKQFQYVGGCHCLYRKNFAGAATERICSTREKFAEVVARYLDFPGLRPPICRKLVCQALLTAAELHVVTNPHDDASADPRRAPGLALAAWRLRPKNVEYLWKAVRYWVGNLIPRRKPLPAGPISASEHRMPTQSAA